MYAGTCYAIVCECWTTIVRKVSLCKDFYMILYLRLGTLITRERSTKDDGVADSILYESTTYEAKSFVYLSVHFVVVVSVENFSSLFHLLFW